MASDVVASVEPKRPEIGESDGVSRRIQAGLASLVFAGLLIGVGILIRGPMAVLQNPSSNPTAFAALVTSSSFRVWMVTTVASVPLRIFGFLGLYALLRDTRYELAALVGLLVGVTSLALFGHVIGLSHFTWPAVGRLYRNGATEMIQLAGFPGYSIEVFGLSIVLELVAIILFSVAMWRSKRLPRGAIALFAIHIVPLKLAGILGHRIEALGGFVLALSAAWMILAIRS